MRRDNGGGGVKNYPEKCYVIFEQPLTGPKINKKCREKEISGSKFSKLPPLLTNTLKLDK